MDAQPTPHTPLIREEPDKVRASAAAPIDAHQPLSLELLYTDQIGRQRTISRFGLIPANGMWLASLNRHWYLDWDGPRPESLTMAAAKVVLSDHDAAQERRAAGDDLGALPPTDGGGSATQAPPSGR